MTILWTVGGLAVSLGLFAGAAAIWPDLAGVLGHVAGIPTLLISALAGISHMRSHRRATPPPQTQVVTKEAENKEKNPPTL